MFVAAGDHGAAGPYRSNYAGPEAPRAPPMIVCQGLAHAFGRHKVLRGVTFEVARGSVYGFIGPNGAGKTTTLRILATLLEPTSGAAHIGGHDVTSHPEEVRRVVGYMPDGHGAHERVAVREYLDFFASAHGLRRDERERAVARAIELTDLGALRSTLLTALSKGQRQRVLLARTLLPDPEVLLLDEPASDLDPRARIELRTLLAELARLGKTILLSSHILTELAELCDAVGVLEGGRIVVSGPVREVEASARPGRRVRLAVVDGADRAVALLRASAQVSSVEVGDRQPSGAVALAVTHAGDERTVAELVSALVQAGVAVCAVEPERADLERIFLDVTAPRESAAASEEPSPPQPLLRES
jgi:ABC-2 type transport system ATP-binding protein